MNTKSLFAVSLYISSIRSLINHRGFIIPGGRKSSTLVQSGENMSDKVTSMIAAIQMTSTSDKKANLEATVKLVEYAAQYGASLICLPECSSYIGGGTLATLTAIEANSDSELSSSSIDSSGSSKDTKNLTSSCPVDTLAASETLEGPYATFLCSLAKKLGVWLSVGGFPEQVSSINKCEQVESEGNSSPNTETTNKVYNTHFIISPSGSIVDRYRKIHLFDSPLAGLVILLIIMLTVTILMMTTLLITTLIMIQWKYLPKIHSPHSQY